MGGHAHPDVDAAMRRGAISLGSVLGVRITVHPTWIFIFALVTVWLGTTGGPVTGTQLAPAARWVVAPIAAMLFFASVLVHELAHAIVARWRGVPIEEVTLFVFGGAARMERDAPSPGAELAIAIAGPIVSVLLGFALIGVGIALTDVAGIPAAVAAELLLGLGVINVLLGVLNLLPAFPMDGGRLLRAGLWAFTHDLTRSTRIATRLARGLGLFVIGAGIVLVFEVEPIVGIWAVLVGWFLYRAAVGDDRRMQLAELTEGVAVRDVMDRDVAVVSPNLTLDTFVDQLLSDDAGLYPVTEDGGLVGTIDADQVRRVPKTRWATTRITDVMSRGEALVTLTEPQSVMDAVGRFQTSPVPAIPVVDGADPRRLLGLVTRDGVIRALRRREALRGS
jgi:Zn-dependent protease/CBS domain-containing protein